MKLRFNLGRGANYKMWRVEDANKQVSYYNPLHVSLLLHNCKLRNQPAAANKIFCGANKTVCAWVEMESFEIVSNIVGGERITYNPRLFPFWNLAGENVDGKEFKTLLTIDNQIFTI